jgi:hypothetical protein
MSSVFVRRLVGPIPGLLILSTTFSIGFAWADDIAVPPSMRATTVVEIFVEHGELRVELETGVPDLVTFEGVFPDDFRVRMGLESEPDDERLKRFFSEDFVVRADDGPPLPGKLESFETRRRTPRDEITGEPLPVDDGQGQPVVFVVLSYELAGRPDSLTIRPPTDEDGSASAAIGLMAYHLGLPVMDVHLLESEETLDLDWEDPLSSTFRNRDLGRRIDSPLEVFLYVEPFEVRVEIIARPRDLQPWTDLGVQGRETIPGEIQADVKQRAAAFLAQDLDLIVDGERVEPLLDRVDFVERRLRTSTPVEELRQLDSGSATLRLIFVQPRTGYPQDVTVDWKLFPEGGERVFGSATDLTGSLPVVLGPGDTELCWEYSSAIPAPPAMIDVWPVPSAMGRVVMWISWIALAVVAVLLLGFGARAAGGGIPWKRVGVLAVVAAALAAGSWVSTRSALIDKKRASEVVSALLNNVYLAAGARDVHTARELLARSVGSNLLAEVAFVTRGGLEVAEQGGIRASLQAVELTDLTMLESERGIGVRCAWNVVSVVGHWGHSHQRTDRHVADLRIDDRDGVWKIVSWDATDETRRRPAGEV